MDGVSPTIFNKQLTHLLSMGNQLVENLLCNSLDLRRYTGSYTNVYVFCPLSYTPKPPRSVILKGTSGGKFCIVNLETLSLTTINTSKIIQVFNKEICHIIIIYNNINLLS